MSGSGKFNRGSILFFCLCLLAAFLGWLRLDGSEVRADPPGIGAAALKLSLSTFAAGLDEPLSLVNAGSNDTRLFIYDEPGRIKKIQSNGQVLATPFLNITGRVKDNGSEEGLLGLTFHPNYATNGYFYVNYTHMAGSVTYTRISRFKVSGNP